jgi:hypothetical protein
MKIEHKRIMIVGWFNPRYSAEGLAQGFESNGFEVIRVASDEATPNKSGRFDYHLMEYYISALPYKDKTKSDKGRWTMNQLNEIVAIQGGRRLFYLKWIVDKLEKPLDFILVIQYECPASIEGIDIPVGYYLTETCDPSLPLGRNIDFLFYAFVDGLSKLSRIYPFWKQQWIHTKLIPHAINKDVIPTDFKPLSERKIKIGFKGLLELNTREKNPLVKYIYAERKRFVNLLLDTNTLVQKQNWLQKLFKRKIPEPVFKLENNTNWKAYVEFMSDCQLALNVPGIDGYINQRQYETLAFGCLLLQYYYDELPELGFYGDPKTYPDLCNCLWFRNEKELLDRYNWYISHPIEAQAIANRGRNWLFESNQTWQGRAKMMLDELTRDDDELMYEIHNRDKSERKRLEMEAIHNAN